MEKKQKKGKKPLLLKKDKIRKLSEISDADLGKAAGGSSCRDSMSADTIGCW